MTAPRPQPFVLCSTDHGPMICATTDRHLSPDGRSGYGVGYQLLTAGAFDPQEVEMAKSLLGLRLARHGPGVFAVDVGANIGVHTVEWARHMHGWGNVLAFEAQPRLYYALAGNVALQNCLNAVAVNAAVGADDGVIRIPAIDYTVQSSFGSLELRKREGHEFIGQTADYDNNTVPVPLARLDSMGLDRVDMIKIDVEGMELEVLDGAAEIVRRCRPIMLIEVIKTDQEKLYQVLMNAGYTLLRLGINVLAVHAEDPCAQDISTTEAAA